MKTLVVGRSAFADIVIADVSVAPHHAEIVVTDDDRLYLSDCGSETGTWRQHRDEQGGEEPRWRPLRQAFVRPGDTLRLGEYRCTARDLVGMARARTDFTGDGAAIGDDRYDSQNRRLRGRVERDAATGEIVRRRP